MNTSYSLLLVEEKGAIVRMKDLSITSKNSETKLTKNIIDLTYFSLFEFINVKFQNFLLDKSALKIVNGDIFISNSIFTNISLDCSGNENGEGSVLHITSNEKRIIELTNKCHFENCSAKTSTVSNGGAIYVNLNKGYLCIYGNTSFKNCSARSTSNIDGKGYV
jgi:hypothetical protein